MIGKRLGAFVRPEQVAEVWAGVTGLFRDYGYRRLRHRARIKFLVADWGPEKFREVLEKEYLGYALPDGPAPAAPRQGDPRPRGRAPAAGRQQLRRFRAHRGPPVRRHARHAIADAGGGVRQRAGPHHHRAEDGHPGRPAGAYRRARRPSWIGRPAGPADPRSAGSTMACTGIEFCKLAIVETKARAADLISELERRLPDFDDAGHDQPQRLPELLRPHPDRRHRAEGLSWSPTRTASRSRASRSTSAAPERRRRSGSGFGRKVRGLKTTAEELPDYVERVLRRFDATREPRRDLRRLDRPGRRRGALRAASRAVPFYCPYCGDEDLEPQGETDGEWHCRGCTRVFPADASSEWEPPV